ncbi:unnamed protein product, partial [marine sediment metagenome]
FRYHQMKDEPKHLKANKSPQIQSYSYEKYENKQPQ